MKHFRTAKRQALSSLEDLSIAMTEWIGTPTSIIVHTLIFIAALTFGILGQSLDLVLLVLTTLVSLEAIYLAIFIQMTVNRQNTNIEEIAEEVEDLGEEVEDDNQVDAEVTQALKAIEGRLGKLQTDLEVLKKKGLL